MNNSNNTKTAADIRTFYFEGHKIRVAVIDDKPWFILADVCQALGIENPEEVTWELDDNEKAAVDIMDVRFKPQKTRAFATINEAGFSQITVDERKGYTKVHIPHGQKKRSK
jgi:prophage antirepressor-like protein